MKKYIILIILAFAAISSKAQFSIGYSVGYGAYEMNDMKDIFDASLSSLKATYPQVDFRMVDDFPGYVNHTIDAGYRFKRHEVGLKTSFLTTGGKISYSDYTGEYLDKLKLNGYRIALSYRYYLPICEIGKSGSLSLYGELSEGITFTNTDYKGHIKIFDETMEFSGSALDKNTISYTVMPQIGAKLNITPNIGFLVGIGYDFHFEGNVYKQSNFYGHNIKKRVDWSGIRLNAGVAYTFGK